MVAVDDELPFTLRQFKPNRFSFTPQGFQFFTKFRKQRNPSSFFSFMVFDLPIHFWFTAQLKQAFVSLM